MKQNVAAALILLILYLGIHEGRVALLQSGTPEPVEIFSQMVTMLPEFDQQALRDGIPIRSRDHLTRLMEDFLS